MITDAVAGPGQVALGAFVSKEISLDVACAFVAHSVTDSLADYPIHQYFEPSPRLRDYVGSRAGGLVERDPELAIANGVWLQEVWRLFLSNMHDIEFLNWAADLCDKQGTTDAAIKLREHVGQYELNAFPKSYYREARMVQVLDGDDRRLKGEIPKGR